MNPPIVLTSRLEGIYRLRTFNELGECTQDTGEFHNLVTDIGLDFYGSLTSTTGCCSVVCVGSGNTTPAFTDTQLQTLVASTTLVSDTATIYVPAAGTQPNYWSATASYSFATGAAAGNLSEIGVGPAATTLFSRALIVDNTGAPTTITVLPTEILQVTYEFRVYMDISTVNSSYSISAISYATQTKLCSLNTATSGMIYGLKYNGASPSGLAYDTQTLAGTTSLPSGGSAVFTSQSYATYTNGNHYVDGVYTAAVGQANVGGIGSIIINTRLGIWQVVHTPVIPKDNTKALSLTFRVAWTRFTPPP